MSAPYFEDESVTLLLGDALAVLSSLPSASVNCCVTSPPYFGLRDYGVDGQLGAESSPAEYVENLRAVFEQVRRTLADDGTLWLNLGDSYYSGRGNFAAPRPLGVPGQPWGQRKGLLGIPWRVAFALQDDGWTLRRDIVWSKPNAMPESVKDRPSSAHEYVFLLAKSPRYWYDPSAVTRPRDDPHAAARSGYAKSAKANGVAAARRFGGNASSTLDQPRETARMRSVWEVATEPTPWAHFATMASEIAERCILLGCKPGGAVLDPFSGSGTTGYAATKLGRRYVGIDLNREYLDLSLRTRLAQGVLLDGGAA